MPPTLRDESPADLPAIDEIHRRAFAGMPHSQQTEARIVRDLRAAGLLSVSIVADDGGPIGHVAASPVAVADGTPGWYGLGPVAVVPERQRAGIGRALVEAALDRLRASGASGCVVLGEPEYYARFGFRRHPGLDLPGLPPEYFLALPFGDRLPRGAVAYADAFA